ncbi:acyltransferase family protein [Pararcticibacter amylolyticus]|uniref:Acyltransferase n=1 Tax=Pararcticibacter amylolyticus TaxID=2173175 RepID=A0A2U2PLR6_9SPHI|nr:acyltransferase [Pararcticibacter amylolyticus]PWG82268.1 acyltransferase [Pararcticibacter amylolyticus]
MNTHAIDTKPHYQILDGLRGVAALTVVVFHIFEAHATSHLDQVINHGYLAVDFFFLLSGFVIGYAYDDRWHKLTVGGFFKRRLQRLQPMVVLGMIIGGICFYFSDSGIFPEIHNVPVWKLIVVTLIGCTLIPVPISMDIRGWQEMHPVNGPGWSLFFEYLANICYALGLRKAPKSVLTVLVVIAGGVMIHYAVTSKSGDMVGGWSLTPEQLRVGFTRVAFPFLAGLLLSRTARLTYVKNAFLWCSVLLLIFLAMPRIGGKETLWMNGLYDSLTIILAFPLIVYLGASGKVTGAAETRICKFLGDISYPIYITHYPFIYIYTGWAVDHRDAGLNETLLYASLTFVISVIVGYASLKLYDEPVRAWLKRKWH